MSSVGDEVKTSISEDFGFKKVGQATILPSYDEKLPFSSLQNLDIANGKDRYIATSGGKVVIGELQLLRNFIQNDARDALTFLWESVIEGVILVKFLPNDSLIVVLRSGTVYSMELHELDGLKEQCKFSNIIVATSYIKPQNVLLSLDTEGNLYGVNLSNNESFQLSENISAFSTQGGKIYTLNKDYSIESYQLLLDEKALEKVNEIPIPEEILEEVRENYAPLSINILDETHILVVYGEPVTETTEDVMYDHKTYIVNALDGQFTFQESFDIAPAFGSVLRYPNYYNTIIPNLILGCNRINVITSPCSSEVTIWDSKEVVQPSQDSERAVLPISKVTDNDTNPIGMALDVSTTGIITDPCPGIESTDALPLIYILNNEGNIQILGLYHATAMKQNDFNMNSLRECIKSTGQSASVTNSPNSTATEYVDVKYKDNNENISKPTDNMDNINKAPSISETETSDHANLSSSYQPKEITNDPFKLESNPTFNDANNEEKATAKSNELDKKNESPFSKLSLGTQKSTTASNEETHDHMNTGMNNTFSKADEPISDSNKSKPNTAFGKSMFGQISSSQTEKPFTFGSPSFGQSSFGKMDSSKVETAPAFGTPSFGTHSFGTVGSGKADSESSFAEPAFGSFGKPTFGQSSFGQPDKKNSETSTAFGTPSFGAPSFGKPSFGKPCFGNMNSTTTDSESAFGKPAFGESTFGKTDSNNNEITSSFGNSSFGKISFGSMNSTKTDSDSAFSKPAFGSFGKPAFGSFGKPTFGESAFGKTDSNNNEITSSFGNSSFGKISFGSMNSEKTDSDLAFGKPSFEKPLFDQTNFTKPKPFTATANPHYVQEGSKRTDSGNSDPVQIGSSSASEKPISGLSLADKTHPTSEHEKPSLEQSSIEITNDEKKDSVSQSDRPLFGKPSLPKPSFGSSFNSQLGNLSLDNEAFKGFNNFNSKASHLENPFISKTNQPSPFASLSSSTKDTKEKETTDDDNNKPSSDSSQSDSISNESSNSETATPEEEPSEDHTSDTDNKLSQEKIKKPEEELIREDEETQATASEDETDTGHENKSENLEIFEKARNTHEFQSENNHKIEVGDVEEPNEGNTIESSSFSDDTVEDTENIDNFSDELSARLSSEDNSISSITARIKQNANLPEKNSVPDVKKKDGKAEGPSPFSSFTNELKTATPSFSFADICNKKDSTNDTAKGKLFANVKFSNNTDKSSTKHELNTEENIDNDQESNDQESCSKIVDFSLDANEESASANQPMRPSADSKDINELTNNDSAGEESYDILDDISQKELFEAIQENDDSVISSNQNLSHKSLSITPSYEEIAVQVSPSVVSKGYQTEPVGYSDFKLQTFEDDESHLATANLPKPLKEYFISADLGKIEYSSQNSTTRAIEKNYHTICAEFEVLNENISNLGMFISDESNNTIIQRSLTTVPNVYTWRISEADKFNDILREEIAKSPAISNISELEKELTDLSNSNLNMLSQDAKKFGQLYDQLQVNESNSKLSGLKYHQSSMQIKLRKSLSQMSEKLDHIEKSLQIFKLCAAQRNNLDGNPLVDTLSKDLFDRQNLFSMILRLRGEIRDLKLEGTKTKKPENSNLLPFGIEVEAVSVVDVGLLLNTKKQFGSMLKNRTI